MSLKIRRFIDCYVPTERCNFKCTYCYIGQRKGFTGNIYKYERAPYEYRKALSKNRLGGIVFFNFCAGGETLFDENLLDIIYELLLEGHVIQIVTNGTITKSFKEISTWDEEILKRLFIKFSFHYLELKRTNQLDKFFKNISLMKSCGVSFSLEITPCDELIPYINEIKECTMREVGALPHITVARDNSTSELKILSQLSKKEYIETWGQFDSLMFDLKIQLLSQKRKEFCYAGEWTLYLNLLNGDLKQCYKGDIIDNIFADSNMPLKFRPIGHNCRESYCFNGHAWLTWGAIPNMNFPTYGEMRNRITSQGEEWLTPTIKEAFECKLEDVNTIYENVDSIPKVLMLGDSILAGYIDEVKKIMDRNCYIYYNGEIARTSTYLYRYLNEWAYSMKIGTNIDIVCFNVGLWDILQFNGEEEIIPVDMYKKTIKKILKQICFLFPNAKIVFVTTTPVIEEEWIKNGILWRRENRTIVEYNKAAVEIMKKYNVKIIDLYNMTEKFDINDYKDETHFNESANIKIAKFVSENIKQILFTNYGEFENNVNWLDYELRINPEKIREYRVIVYGAGMYGKLCVEKLANANVDVALILDRNDELKGSTIGGADIITPKKYIESKYKEGDLIVLGLQNEGLWNNVITNFKELKDISLCSYKVTDNL